jgi:hypothetical protein
VFAGYGVIPSVWKGRALAAGVIESGGELHVGVWFDEPSGWRRTDLPASAGTGIWAVVFLETGPLVITGGSGGDANLQAWMTADGLEWHRASVDGLDGFLGLAAVRGGQLVAILDGPRIVLAEL